MTKPIAGRLPTGDPLIIVVGCGRSGTLYITKFWKVFDKKIGHEKYGRDGIASWYLLLPHVFKQFKEEIYFPRAKRFIFFHQVRHPLKVISSMYPRKWDVPQVTNIIRLKNTDSRLEQCMKYWYYWNRNVDRKFKIKLRYRIEDIQTKDLIERLAHIVGVPHKGRKHLVRAIPTNTHTAYKKTYRSKGYKHIFTWKELFAENSYLAMNVYNLARKYGYY